MRRLRDVMLPIRQNRDLDGWIFKKITDDHAIEAVVYDEDDHIDLEAVKQDIIDHKTVSHVKITRHNMDEVHEADGKHPAPDTHSHDLDIILMNDKVNA